MRTKSRYSLLFCLLFFALLFLPGFNSSLADISFPKKLKKIDTEAFYADSSLEKVTLPDGLERIESKAFAQSSVKTIVFPDSINFIAEDAFDGCNIYAVKANENSYAYNYAIRHRLAIEYPPEKVVLDSVNVWDTGARIKWYRAKGATGYIVYYGTSSKISSAKSLVVGNQTTVDICRLKTNTKYYFWVRGINSFQQGAASQYMIGATKTRGAIEVSCNHDLYVTVGESVEVTVWLNSGNEIWYDCSSDIISCEWSNEWNNNKTTLIVTGKQIGTTWMDIECDADVTFNFASLYVKVIPKIPDGTITGDIGGLLHTDMETVNHQLPDKLRYFDEDAYTNDFFLVLLNDNGGITTIALLTDAEESEIGKYTLFGVYPGMTLGSAKALLIAAGFHQSSTKHFISDFGGGEIDITLIDGKVDLITYR